VEQSYNLNDYEAHNADSYNSYESAPEWDDRSSESGASYRWRIWHVILLVLLLIFVAAVIVYVVLPYITSFTTTPSASQLPIPVQV
jgi:hypothetical protein